MGKKKREEMAEQRAVFIKGCAELNKIPAAKANQIFDLLEKFAGYGFNKSHAAAYAVVAYQTAYLKANYPVEFFCAMMTNDMADTEKLSQYIAEARGNGYRGAAAGCEREPGAFCARPTLGLNPSRGPVRRPPCLGDPLRAGRHKGVGEIAVEAILKARSEGGKFQSLANMCERVDGAR